MSSLVSGRMASLLEVACRLCPRTTSQTAFRKFSKGRPEFGQEVRQQPAGTRRVFRPDRFKKHSESAKYVMLVIPLATFGLGTWQVYRRRWKLGLIADLEEKTSAEPINLPQDLQELDDLEYRRVRVTGSFDHAKEVYVRPRSLFIDGREQESSGLVSSSQSSGLHVVTPFKLSDRDLTILINRGWVSRQQTKPLSRASGQVEGEVELVGIVRQSETRAPLMPKNIEGSRFFFYRDVEAMARVCDVAPVFLDADFASTVPGGPQGGQTKVSLRNEHLSYIFTWYSLSAATLFMWYRIYIKRPLK